MTSKVLPSIVPGFGFVTRNVQTLIKAEPVSRTEHSTPDSAAGRREMLARCLSLVVVGLCLLVMADSEKSPLDEVRDRCKEEHHLLDGQMSALNKTKELETDDQNIKCFIKCLSMGLNIMTEDGEITPGDPSGMYYKSVYACKDVQGSDSCDKAVNLRNCMWRLRQKEERDEAE